MAFATAPDSLPDLCPPQVVREHLVVSRDVGTAPENRVAFTPFHWKSACVEACAGTFELQFEPVGSEG